MGLKRGFLKKGGQNKGGHFISPIRFEKLLPELLVSGHKRGVPTLLVKGFKGIFDKGL